MNAHRFCTRSVAVFALISGVAAMAQNPLTLEDAVRIARQSAFGVIDAQANAKGVAETIQQARSAALPRLTFDASYLRYDREIAVVFDPMSPPVVVRPIDRKSLQFNLMQPVDLFGIYRLGVDGARSLQRASDRQLDAARNNAGAEAKSAFFQVLQAQEFVGVAEEQLAAAKEHLRVSEEQYAAGKVARFDVIRFQADASSAEQNLILALNGVELAKASFNFVLSRPTSTPVALVRPEGLPAVTKSMEELIQLAHETRPEVLAAEHVVEYQIKYRQARQREGLPTLNVQVNFTRDPDASGFGAAKDTASAAAFFSFPLFDGGLTRARVGHARQEEARAENALNQVSLAVEVDVRQAYLTVVASRKIIESAEKNVDVARETLRLANLRYREGIGTPVEVSDATALYTRARSAHVSAVYDYWNAVADLQRAVGSEDV